MIDMRYSKSQYLEMARRFNMLKTEGKLLLIKMHPDLFRLEHYKEDWYMFRLQEEWAMEEGLDFLFNMPNELTKEQLIDIKL